MLSQLNAYCRYFSLDRNIVDSQRKLNAKKTDGSWKTFSEEAYFCPLIEKQSEYYHIFPSFWIAFMPLMWQAINQVGLHNDCAENIFFCRGSAFWSYPNTKDIDALDIKNEIAAE